MNPNTFSNVKGLKLDLGPPPGSIQFDEETKQRIQAAQAAGVPEEQIQQEAIAYQMRKSQTSQTAPQEKKGFRASDLLPIAGGIIGGVGGSFIAPGAGTLIGGGAGSAAGEALRQMLEGEKADIGKVVTEGALGAIPVGKVLGPAGKLISKVGVKTAGKVAETTIAKSAVEKGLLERGATALDEGVRKIRVRPAVGGAQKEKAINETLNRLGFKDSAQKQYENLQPAMDKLEGEIQQIIKANPEVTVLKEDIKSSFLNKLETSTRSKDLTQTQAQTEVTGYLNDLMKASGGTGKFTNINLERLRQLKKLVNQDYGPVNDILERGGALTPRQKVIHVSWSSLDDAVKTASPEMKKVLMDESNLYQAASSLSAARSNPPTFRVAGTSIPAWATQKGLNVLSGGLRTPGRVGEKLSANTMASEALRQSLAQPGKRIGANLLGIGQKTPEELSPEQSLSESLTSSPMIPQAQQAVDQAVTQSSYVTGYSPEELYSAYSRAISAGDKASATQLRQMYTDETAYQKTQGGGNKPLPVAAQTQVNLAKSGVRGLTVAEQIYNDDPDILTKQLVPGQWVSRKFDSAMFKAVEALLRARSGAAVPETEVKRYLTKYGPIYGDSPDVVKFKFEQLQQDFMDVLEGSGNTAGSTDMSQTLAAQQAIGF